MTNKIVFCHIIVAADALCKCNAAAQYFHLAVLRAGGRRVSEGAGTRNAGRPNCRAGALGHAGRPSRENHAYGRGGVGRTKPFPQAA